MLTSIAVLGIWEFEGWKKLLVSRIREGDSQVISDLNNVLQLVGRHRRGVRERETPLVKQPRSVSYLKRGSCVPSARAARVSMEQADPYW